MMERSAPLPVHFDRPIGPYFADTAAALAASGLLSASRIRTLRLFGPPADILEVLNHLRSPSPLESLTLCITSAEELVNIPETLCARATPHLRRLTFGTDACIRAPLWLLAGVTHFTTSATTSMHGLLGTLQAMPQLEELCITRNFDDFWPEQLPLARVALPRLSLLTVRENSPHFFVALSAYIDDAPPTTLRRHLFWPVFLLHGWEPNIFTAALDLVPRDSALGTDDGGLRAAQVTGGPERGSFEVWSRTTRTARAARSDALFLFRLDWQHDLIFAHGASGPPDELCPFFHLASLCAHLQTTRVEDLTVAPSSAARTASEECMRPKVVAQWRALLAALPAVKILRMHGSCPAGTSVLRVLTEFPELLPHLRKVFVARSTVLCAGGVAGTSASSTMVINKNMGPELMEAMSVRSGLEVVLVGCEVDEEALEALRERARVEFGNEWEYMQSVSLE